jgi:hypothetical protein
MRVVCQSLLLNVLELIALEGTKGDSLVVVLEEDLSIENFTNRKIYIFQVPCISHKGER